jgi:micrococcal nuclease
LKKNRNLLLATMILACAEALSAQPLRDLVGIRFNARVISVSDGDTVDAIPEGEARAVRVRLDGVDAPERGEPFSQQARSFIRVLLFEQTAQAAGRDVDRYGRLVARLNVAGKDTSLEVVRAGLACHYTDYSADPLLARAEIEARNAGRGFWAKGAQRPACATREGVALGARASRQRDRPASTGFNANTASGVYHASWCRNFRCRNCTRSFAAEAEAKAAGFHPAGDCLGKR